MVGASQENPGGNFSHAFLWDNVNGLQNLNDLLPLGSGWELQEARDINDSGEIVGWGLIKINTVVEEHIFVWDLTNAIQDLGRRGSGRPLSINNSGQITGQDESNIGFIWDSINGKQSLGTLGGTFSLPRDIRHLS